MRCFTCNLPISNKHDDFKKLVLKYSSSSLLDEDRIYRVTEENLKTDSPEKKALDDLGITKYCCRRMLITHTDVVEIMN